jgi:hypothetical protein
MIRYFVEFDLSNNPVGVWAQDDSGLLDGVDFAYVQEAEDLEAEARQFIGDLVEANVERVEPGLIFYLAGQARYGRTARSQVYQTKQYPNAARCVKGILEKLRRREEIKDNESTQPN